VSVGRNVSAVYAKGDYSEHVRVLADLQGDYSEHVRVLADLQNQLEDLQWTVRNAPEVIADLESRIAEGRADLVKRMREQADELEKKL
jgi:predicted  nucleic acid-binding Zn-ribbon protein